MKLFILSLLFAVIGLAQIDYVLQPRDRLLITAPEADGLNGRMVQIRPDGSVTLPLLGKMNAGGITLKVFEKRVSDLLKHDSANASPVTVRVVANSSQKSAN